MQAGRPSTTGRLSIGERFAGRFDVRDFLGAGGEFDVYLALDRATGEEVALKVLVLPGDPRFGQTVASTVADDIAARRDGLAAMVALHRETLDAIADGRESVVIARVWEASTEGDPCDWFVVEELVRAAFTLGDWLRIERDARRVCAALGALGRLLSQLHERGVIHRDVHGGNVLVDADGRLWFTDFSHAIRPLRRGSFALLSPWNAPEERTDAPLTASADVYGFARLLLSALAHHGARLSRERDRRALFVRLEALRARWVECAPEARGSLVSLLDELRAIARFFDAPRAAVTAPQRRWAAAAALLALGAGALAMNARPRDRAPAVATPIPVTFVRMSPERPLLEWRDGPAPPAPAPAAERASDQPARRLDFARGRAAFREDSPSSERLADYAASEFLREARRRASKGWGAACLRSTAPAAPREASATFRVTLSPASDARGGRVDSVALVRASNVDERTARCLRARIADVAAADPGQTITAELALRLSREDAPRVALR
jgi:hypothetical protein